MKNFWLTETSPKSLFYNMLQKDNPHATFWDVFSDYARIPSGLEAPNTSEQWLAEKDKLIQTIINFDLAHVTLSRIQIENLCCAIEAFVFDGEEPLFDYLDANLILVAKKIAQDYLVPKTLTQATVYAFLDDLQEGLEKKDEKHITASDKDSFKKLILELPYYSEEKKQEIIKNLEQLWEVNPNIGHDMDNDFKEDFEKELETAQDLQEAYFWPEINLAHSQTFYGFNDAGHLSYQAQETLAEQKYNAYVSQITQLLAMSPHEDFFPVNFNISIDNYDVFEAFASQYHLAYEFEHKFTIWKGNDRVLFLILRREDKELPYQIVLGGMMLQEYATILNKYNELNSSKP